MDYAITEDLTPREYVLGTYDLAFFGSQAKNHAHGTIIGFENIKDGIRRSFDFLGRIIALYFRFSLLDKSFNIFLNGEKITYKHLNDLAQKTQFLWEIGEIEDPFVAGLKNIFSKSKHEHESKKLSFANVTGFLASVEKPRDLKITSTQERVGVDLFVNGRLRERDVLKHIPTARLVENYLYGQLHFNSLDDEVDRFTSSREGIVADDPKFNKFLDRLRKVLLEAVEDWDRWRIKHRQVGDAESDRIPLRERASLNLYGAVSKEYDMPKSSKRKDDVASWVEELAADAAFNFESYAECFISENLVRKYIEHTKTPLSKEAQDEANTWKTRETESKNKGNISIDIRRVQSDLSYLDMKNLSYLVDKKDPVKEACLPRDAAEYKPMRDAVAHTALLTDAAKVRLRTVRENIKGRIKKLLK